MAPSVDSYSQPGVFFTYKRNHWFESIKIIELKREKALQTAEFLKELDRRQKHEERERAKQRARELELQRKQEAAEEAKRVEEERAERRRLRLIAT